MELIFVHIEELRGFKNPTSINFSNRFTVSLKLNSETGIREVEIEGNDSFIPNFFGSEVSNVTALIGKNGVGKTTLIEFLINIFNSANHNPNWMPDFYVAIFYDIKTEKIYIKVSDSDSDYSTRLFEDNFVEPEEFLGDEAIFDNKTSISVKTSLEYESISQIESTQTVFYTPIIDLKNFPIYFDNKSYADVSTDFLLIHDPQNVDDLKNPIEVHRFKNVERQYLFVKQFSENDYIKDRFPIPNELI